MELSNTFYDTIYLLGDSLSLQGLNAMVLLEIDDYLIKSCLLYSSLTAFYFAIYGYMLLIVPLLLFIISLIDFF